jgi:periplasmic protein TonB
MTRKTIFQLQLWGTAIILSTTIFGCTSDDTSSSSSDAKDTAATATVTPMSSVTDSAKMNAATMDSATASIGKPAMAKPNPAKKGLKGKVTILPPPAMVANARMEADNSGVYSNVEVYPSFPGGNAGLQKFFDKNLEYPEEAGNNGVEGTVMLTFVVDEKGKLTNPEVSGGTIGYGLETEALRVVNKMPVWNPGQLKGKNVKTKFTLPIKFVLE